MKSLSEDRDFSCLTKTTSCASGSEKLLAMYQKSPPKVLY